MSATRSSISKRAISKINDEMKTVVLKNGRDRSVRMRHPWIFSGAIAAINETAAADDVSELKCAAIVKSAKGEILGAAEYSAASQIALRMLSFGEELRLDESLIVAKVRDAVKRREGFAAREKTNAYRVINAEGDGLPGVVVDCYDGFLVCQLTSAFADANRDLLAKALMAEVPEARGVSVRNDVDARRHEGLDTDDAPCCTFEVIAGEEPPELIEIREEPIRYHVDVRNGHKTGFYLDQRAARRAVGRWARDRRVLNCFSYTGGFGLHAMAGGAKSVLQVDISGPSLELARKNAALSNLDGIETQEDDVFRFLRKCRDEGRKFDMIVLDPPKFAEKRSQIMKAARGYKDINLLAMKLLDKGGVLATFSCSGAMTNELFNKVVMEAAADAKKDFAIVERTAQAADHPVPIAFPEGLYLKGLILQMSKSM